MLTITRYKDAQKLIEYFRDHLVSGDYHSEKGKNPGHWVGLTGERFGIKQGEGVREEEFSALVLGIDPRTKQSFLVRKKDNRIPAFEMLFSAPKSVSILAVTLGDERLVEAHNKAVEKAFQELEKLTQTRVRKGLSIRSDEKRVTGNLVAARFQHSTSRSLDPQLHTHNVVMNVTYDPVEKRLKALDAKKIFDNCNFISEVYRSVLAREVMRLGYEIEGGRHTWRIKGVSPEVEAIFSKRSGQIDRAAKRLEEETGVKVSTRGRALLAEKTRRAKDKDLSEEDQVAHQLAQLSKKEKDALTRLFVEAKNRSSQFGDAVDPEKLAETLDYAIKHVFERKSVVPRFDLLKAALSHGCGQVLLEELEEALKGPEFLTRGDNITTKTERNREVRILSLVRGGRKLFPELLSLHGEQEKAVLSQLTDEQREALQVLGKSTDQYLYLRGAAGAGKTFTLTALKGVLETNGEKPPLLLAPSSSATETLRHEGFTDAQTIQRFLVSDDAKSDAKNRLWIVDEAGLLSTKQLEALLKLAIERESRLLLVGDTLQHNGVEGGDGLRLLESYSIIKEASISKITRQKHEKYREAAQLLSQGRVNRAWAIFEELNAIHEISDNSERAKRVAKEYLESLQAGKDTLIVAPTWSEIETITKEVRGVMKEKGSLGLEETTLQVYKSSNFTKAEKEFAPNFDPEKHFVSFFKNEGDFKQGQVWKVLKSENGRIQIEHPEFGKRTVEPKKCSKAFDVVEGDKKEFSKGDKLLIRANYASSKKNKVLNGEVVELDRLEKDGSIQLKDGRTLGAEFRHFSHGYALTSQSSQGKTCDRVLISMNSGSGNALSKNHFYVSATRGKQSVAFFTDSKTELKELIQTTSARTLVAEELVKNRILKKLGQRLSLTTEKMVEAARTKIENTFVKFVDRKEERAREDRFKQKKSQKSRFFGFEYESPSPGP